MAPSHAIGMGRSLRLCMTLCMLLLLGVTLSPQAAAASQDSPGRRLRSRARVSMLPGDSVQPSAAASVRRSFAASGSSSSSDPDLAGWTPSSDRSPRVLFLGSGDYLTTANVPYLLERMLRSAGEAGEGRPDPTSSGSGSGSSPSQGLVSAFEGSRVYAHAPDNYSLGPNPFRLDSATHMELLEEYTGLLDPSLTSNSSDSGLPPSISGAGYDHDLPARSRESPWVRSGPRNETGRRNEALLALEAALAAQIAGLAPAPDRRDIDPEYLHSSASFSLNFSSVHSGTPVSPLGAALTSAQMQGARARSLESRMSWAGSSSSLHGVRALDWAQDETAWRSAQAWQHRGFRGSPDPNLGVGVFLGPTSSGSGGAGEGSEDGSWFDLANTAPSVEFPHGQEYNDWPAASGTGTGAGTGTGRDASKQVWPLVLPAPAEGQGEGEAGAPGTQSNSKRAGLTINVWVLFGGWASGARGGTLDGQDDASAILDCRASLASAAEPADPALNATQQQVRDQLSDALADAASSPFQMRAGRVVAGAGSGSDSGSDAQGTHLEFLQFEVLRVDPEELLGQAGSALGGDPEYLSHTSSIQRNYVTTEIRARRALAVHTDSKRQLAAASASGSPADAAAEREEESQMAREALGFAIRRNVWIMYTVTLSPEGVLTLYEDGVLVDQTPPTPAAKGTGRKIPAPDTGHRPQAAQPRARHEETMVDNIPTLNQPPPGNSSDVVSSSTGAAGPAADDAPMSEKQKEELDVLGVLPPRMRFPLEPIERPYCALGKNQDAAMIRLRKTVAVAGVAATPDSARVPRGTRYFRGQLAQLELWHRVLPHASILTLFLHRPAPIRFDRAPAPIDFVSTPWDAETGSGTRAKTKLSHASCVGTLRYFAAVPNGSDKLFAQPWQWSHVVLQDHPVAPYVPYWLQHSALPGLHTLVARILHHSPGAQILILPTAPVVDLEAIAAASTDAREAVITPNLGIAAVVARDEMQLAAKSVSNPSELEGGAGSFWGADDEVPFGIVLTRLERYYARLRAWLLMGASANAASDAFAELDAKFPFHGALRLAHQGNVHIVPVLQTLKQLQSSKSASGQPYKWSDMYARGAAQDAKLDRSNMTAAGDVTAVPGAVLSPMAAFATASALFAAITGHSPECSAPGADQQCAGYCPCRLLDVQPAVLPTESEKAAVMQAKIEADSAHAKLEHCGAIRDAAAAAVRLDVDTTLLYRTVSELAAQSAWPNAVRDGRFLCGWPAPADSGDSDPAAELDEAVDTVHDKLPPLPSSAPPQKAPEVDTTDEQDADAFRNSTDVSGDGYVTPTPVVGDQSIVERETQGVEPPTLAPFVAVAVVLMVLLGVAAGIVYYRRRKQQWELIDQRGYDASDKAAFDAEPEEL